MKIIYKNPKKIKDIIVYKPDVFLDNRGYFYETFQKIKLANIGINEDFPQDNRSFSKKNVIRGIHFLKGKQQAQLLSVVEGKIWDVIVDLRKDSKTFKKWFALELSDKNHHHLYIPRGFGHGFCVLSKKAKINYKTTEYFNKNNEKGIKWDDKDLNIKWPIKNPILNKRDKTFPYFKEIIENNFNKVLKYNLKNNEPYLIKIPFFSGKKASLSYFEPKIYKMKNIKRIFYIKGNKNVKRGGHAHKKCNQFLICQKGKVRVNCISSKKNKRTFLLKNNKTGLFINKMTWTDIEYLENDTITNVICDRRYEAHDYIYDYKKFIKMFR